MLVFKAMNSGILKGYKCIEKIKADALIVPVFEGSKDALSSDILRTFTNQIKALFDSGEFVGKETEVSLMHISDASFKRVVFVGLGKGSKYQEAVTGIDLPFPYMAQERLRRAGGKAFRFVKEKGFERIAVAAEHLAGLRGTTHLPLYYFLEGGLLSIYDFTAFKNKDEGKEIRDVHVIDEAHGDYIGLLSSVTASSKMARDLINSPSNHVTPTFLYETARSMENRYLKVHLLSEKELLKEGMNGFLAVARGSSEPHRFFVMEYKRTKTTPIALIGKAITFDSGGISIKPSEGMEKMKYDMAGGAAVLALIKALSTLDFRGHIIAIIPATENMPDGKAYKPGDVIKMMNGKNVEIISTDAEGRMTLADAITYAIKYYKPSAIIDIATLTGACAMTFGGEYIGMMGNNQRLMDKLIHSGNEVYERVWSMPLCDEYGEYIKGEAGDLKNSGGRKGAMLTAGYFLKEFAGDTPWLHLDIASTAWIEKDRPYMTKGASASGMRLLLDFLMRYV